MSKTSRFQSVKSSKSQILEIWVHCASGFTFCLLFPGLWIMCFVKCLHTAMPWEEVPVSNVTTALPISSYQFWSNRFSLNRVKTGFRHGDILGCKGRIKCFLRALCSNGKIHVESITQNLDAATVWHLLLLFQILVFLKLSCFGVLSYPVLTFRQGIQ